MPSSSGRATCAFPSAPVRAMITFPPIFIRSGEGCKITAPKGHKVAMTVDGVKKPIKTGTIYKNINPTTHSYFYKLPLKKEIDH